MADTHAGGVATATRPGLSAIRFPQLGESVVEGTVLQWLVKEGDTVTQDQLLLEVETEKVVAEIPSPFDGVVDSYAVEIGQSVLVGTVLMYIAEAGMETGQARLTGSGAATGTVVPPTTEDPEDDTFTTAMAEGSDVLNAAPATSDVATPAPTTATTTGATNGASTSGATNGTAATAGYVEAADAAVRYSPAVRKLAREFSLDPATVKGTGAGGRVTREDMMRAQGEASAKPQAPSVVSAPPAATPAATAPSPAAVAPVTSAPPVSMPAAPAPAPSGTLQRAASAAPQGDLIPMTTLRRRTAEALTRASQTIPQAATWLEADITDLVRRREAEKEAFRAREGVSLTYLPFFVQAALAGIRQYPVISSQWTDEGIRLKRDVGMGIAVSTDDGLVVPVIQHAGDYSITGLARVMNEKIRRARAGRLTLDDISGGTLTLTNPGSFGSLRTLALVRPNEATMFSVDAILEKPIVRNGGIAIRSIVTVGCSFDHRIFDGREAVLFLNVVREWLETQAANAPL